MRRPPLLATLTAILTALAAVFSAAPGASATPIAIRGGDTLYGDGTRCTVSFNARGGGTYYGIIAGHCAGTGTTWYADAARTVPVGTTAGNGLVRYTNTALSYPGEINLGGGAVQDITGAAAPRYGQSVCHLGRSGGLRCGRVTGLNLTINYGGDIVTGLFRTDACTEAGDAGGPTFSGTTALGVIVGGSGNCSFGGTTFHQPITEFLAAHGLSLY
ncbi:S1 family peptidase [Streptomyces megasporus]|uniref:S1 family peptidase n=1 Tax=Streptomyces megasporus TaxID=44060 RepID=UPI0004E10137|nr:S1 family peptidase [Streptomyces megasporus]